MKKSFFLALAVCVAMMSSCGDDEYFGSPDYGRKDDPEEEEETPTEASSTVLFKNGESISGVTYVTFRIPSLVRTKSKVFAFCEARTVDEDRGDIDIAYRVSTDNGKTWGDKTMLWSDSDHTVGNPCCVYTSSGRLVMVFNWQVSSKATGKSFPSEMGVTYQQNNSHSRRVFVTWSDDEGKTWSTPKDITDSVMEKGWTWNAAGPCHAIQLRTGTHKGRIIVPCDLKESGSLPASRSSYVIYSDDNGQTWSKSAKVEGGNECCAVELSDGTLMLDMRNIKNSQYGGSNCRAWVTSIDGGETWGTYNLDEGRPEPTYDSTVGCQGSIINYTTGSTPSSNIIFSNPASTTSRVNMTLRFSKDDAGTWSKSVLVTSDRAGYSDLVVLSDGGLGLLYETGVSWYHDSIVMACYPKATVEEYFK